MRKFSSKIIFLFMIFPIFSCSPSKFHNNQEQDLMIKVQASRGYMISPVALYNENESLLLEGNVNNINQIDEIVRGHVDITMIASENKISVMTADLQNISTKNISIKPSTFLIREHRLKKSFFSCNLPSALPRGSVIQVVYDQTDHQHKKD